MLKLARSEAKKNDDADHVSQYTLHVIKAVL
jgi:hypothetical protein